MDEIGMSMKHLQKLKDHENEPRSEYGNLPPELKAMQTMMDMVFGAIAAPQAGQCSDSAPSNEGHAAGPAVAASRRMDIETAILRAPGFDYLLASEIFAALQRRLELEYEDRLNTELADRMARLAKSFDNITGAA